MNTHKLSPIAHEHGVSLYQIKTDGLTNRYYMLSSHESTRLMAHPEVVSMEAYYALVAPTEQALRMLQSQGVTEKLEICTILRGGLNYPLEEACYKAGLCIGNIHFLSCERIIENHVITGLEIKYSKLTTLDGVTLMFGDILASGMTFELCIRQIIAAYRQNGCRIRRILFFTIGGTRAFEIFERLTSEVRTYWPDFEGVDCFFYEGAFSVYEQKGLIGFQVPEIDFFWNGGLIAPEYRRYCMEHLTPILEKCIIYDGGARRYNIPEHRHEVLEYWHQLSAQADSISLTDLFDERVGYHPTADFDQWLQLTGYDEMDKTEMQTLFATEQQCRERLSDLDLRQLAEERISSFTQALAAY